MGSIGAVRTDFEAHFLLQNLMLTGEALRLGGWVHGAPMIPHVMRRDPANNLLGLGFREHLAKPEPGRWRRWPPVPASQPNYVGIDGFLEGLCPPYVTDMDEAVDRVLEEKFGSGGTYADPEVFGQAYRDRESAEGYLKRRPTTRPRRSSTRKRSAATWSRPTGASPRTRTPCTCPASGCSSRTSSSSTTSASRDPGHARRQAEGREIWGR